MGNSYRINLLSLHRTSLHRIEDSINNTQNFDDISVVRFHSLT